jgi:antitoxin (DNA-binding transcriptional repressor) of toxin-antitoxin stability system
MIMQSTKITVTQAARNLSDVVNRVVYRGEQFVLIKGNKSVAQLSPVLSGKKLKELPDIIAKLPGMGADDLNAFEQDLSQARKTSQKESLRDPWAY